MINLSFIGASYNTVKEDMPDRLAKYNAFG